MSSGIGRAQGRRCTPGRVRSDPATGRAIEAIRAWASSDRRSGRYPVTPKAGTIRTLRPPTWGRITVAVQKPSQMGESSGKLPPSSPTPTEPPVAAPALRSWEEAEKPKAAALPSLASPAVPAPAPAPARPAARPEVIADLRRRVAALQASLRRDREALSLAARAEGRAAAAVKARVAVLAAAKGRLEALDPSPAPVKPAGHQGR
jgi:hypothetical protein